MLCRVYYLLGTLGYDDAVIRGMSQCEVLTCDDRERCQQLRRGHAAGRGRLKTPHLPRRRHAHASCRTDRTCLSHTGGTCLAHQSSKARTRGHEDIWVAHIDVAHALGPLLCVLDRHVQLPRRARAAPTHTGDQHTTHTTNTRAWHVRARPPRPPSHGADMPPVGRAVGKRGGSGAHPTLVDLRPLGETRAWMAWRWSDVRHAGKRTAATWRDTRGGGGECVHAGEVGRSSRCGG
jgi:hypothetical protein